MKKDIIKYILVIIAIILVIWLLLVKDNKCATSPEFNKNEIEGVSIE